MKKRLISLLFLLILVLPACGGATDNTSPTDTPEVENGPTSSTRTAQSQELGDLTQPGDRIAGATDTPEMGNGPTSSVATCTAQSQELGDLAQPGDRITGATEDYAVTLIEYGDFQ